LYLVPTTAWGKTIAPHVATTGVKW
jgi:hypothetical protein